MFSFRRLIKSFADALKGLKQVYKSEQNFRIQLFISLIVILASLYFPLKIWERILLVLLMLLVLLVEMLNTAFEYFSDLIKPRVHHYIESIKDIMAGAVLLTALVAVVIGLIIFLPYFLEWAK